MLTDKGNQSNTAAWLERLEQIQGNVHDRLGDDPSADMALVYIADLIDLVRALAERVEALEDGR